MFNDFKYRFSRFMQGRYGVDSLSRFLSGVLIAVIILGLFIRIPFSGLITLAILVVLYWRMFSKDIPKRYEENQKFITFINAPAATRRSAFPAERGTSWCAARAAAMSFIKKADKRQPGDRLFFLVSEMYDHA